jgi:hypothetical protein
MRSKLTINHYGTKIWRLPSGELHRENGPALEYLGGSIEWWLNGLRHREDGPVVELSSGMKLWYINDIRYTEDGYKAEMRSVKLKQLL